MANTTITYCDLLTPQTNRIIFGDLVYYRCLGRSTTKARLQPQHIISAEILSCFELVNVHDTWHYLNMCSLIN